MFWGHLSFLVDKEDQAHVVLESELEQRYSVCYSTVLYTKYVVCIQTQGLIESL